MAKEAMLYTRETDMMVSCRLCAHRCRIKPGARGLCGVRENRLGTLFSDSFGKVIAAHVDPIEKKPLFHFLPGSDTFSIATVGCNFQCGFCQNWQISQVKEAAKIGLSPVEMTPEYIVDEAERNRCRSISYTYTEPTIFFEYAYETARIARERGLKNIFVTNGYMTAEALEMIAPFLDGANVDLKSFSDEYYQNVCLARLGPVMETIRAMRKRGIWVEVTTLILPGRNDSDEELAHLASFIAGVGPEIPWHISRFHPDYKVTDLKETPAATLERARRIGNAAGLRYVYIGNAGQEENTSCYRCGALLIKRFGFSVIESHLKHGACPGCATVLDGTF